MQNTPRQSVQSSSDAAPVLPHSLMGYGGLALLLGVGAIWCGLHLSSPLARILSDLLMSVSIGCAAVLVWHIRRRLTDEAVIALGIGFIFLSLFLIWSVGSYPGLANPGAEISPLPLQLWLGYRFVAAGALISYAVVLLRAALAESYDKLERRSQRQTREMQEQESFAQQVFDSANAHLAVVDASGQIVQINEAWRCFAVANDGGDECHWGVGANYLQVCTRSTEPDAQAIAVGVRAVQQGTIASFECEYACHSPSHQRWFAMRVLPLPGTPGTVLISHADVSLQKFAREVLQETQLSLEAQVAERTTHLRESEERYRQIFETNQAVKLIVDPSDGRLIDANQAACDFYGYARDELLALSIVDINILSAAEVAARMTEARACRQVIFHFPHRLASGEIRQVEVYSGPITVDGRTLLHSIIHDVTERVQAETALEQERRRLAGILEGTNAGTWEWHIQTGATTFNARWAEIVGYTLDELAPMSIHTWLGLVHPDDLPQSDALLQRHFAGTLEYYDCECRMRHRSGDWVWVHDRGRVVEWSPDGRPQVMAGTHTDITARKQIEGELQQAHDELDRRVQARTAELQQSQQLFRALFETMEQGVIYRNALGRITEVNPAAARILGTTRERLLSELGADPRWHAVREDGTPYAAEEHPALVALRTGVPVREVVMGAVLPRQAGPLWVQVTAIPEFHPGEARPYRVFTTFTDITARRQAEELLRLMQFSVDHAADAVAWLRVDGTYAYGNDATCRLLGYTHEEFLQLTVQQINPAITAESWADLWARIIRDKTLSYEAQFRRKDGSLVPVEALVNYIDFAGQQLLCGFMRDITPRKRADAALRASLDEKTVLLKEVHHRVKNNLQVISSLLSLQAVRTQNPEGLEMLQTMQHRVRSMALLHETLYRSENLAQISFPDYVETVCAHLLRAMGSPAITLESRIAAVSLSLDRAVPCGLIITELVSNALKHAFPAGRKGEIRVALQLQPAGQLVLVVADNGVGLPPAVEPATVDSLGLQLVGMLTEQLQGTFEIGRQGGTTVQVVFQERLGIQGEMYE
jgi:PAS domain S-box-containing protein